MKGKMRAEIQAEHESTAVARAQEELARRLTEKGKGAFVSRHEMLGVVTEEYHELVSAVKDGGSAEVLHELLDLAVACLLGVASVKTGQVEWDT